MGNKIQRSTVLDPHRANFNTMERASAEDHLALAVCRDRQTGEEVALICVVNETADGYTFHPIAQMLDQATVFDRYEGPVVPPSSETSSGWLSPPTDDKKSN